MEAWYFAYGSNLCVNQMVVRTGSIGRGEHDPRIAYLADHRLCFQQLANAGPAYANIQAPGDGVLGVVYRCTPAGLASLDGHEHGYDRKSIRVSDQRGEVLTAVTYVMQPALATKAGQPIARYLETIVSGARRHGLPADYIERIVALAGSGMVPTRL